jgi:hypothetical protein
MENLRDLCALQHLGYSFNLGRNREIIIRQSM